MLHEVAFDGLEDGEDGTLDADISVSHHPKKPLNKELIIWFSVLFRNHPNCFLFSFLYLPNLILNLDYSIHILFLAFQHSSTCDNQVLFLAV